MGFSTTYRLVNNPSTYYVIEFQNSAAVIRNGVRYRLTLVSAAGKETDNFIHVLVVDSDSNEVRAS